MIKRFFVLFFVVLLLMPQLSAYADVVIGNEFAYLNEKNTRPIRGRYYGRRFVINSPSGYVIPREEPGSDNGVPSNLGYRSGWGGRDIDEPEHDIFVFRNGEIFLIEATYLHKGVHWGIMSPSHMYQPPGWVLMDEMLMIFEREDFEQIHQHEFYEYTGCYDVVLEAERLVIWEWPGSDREKRIIENMDTIQRSANVLFAYVTAC